ncbi:MULTISPECIES: hypothetical protein [Oxalobacteraceae]|jgi:hypothetical protein|nr:MULTISPECIES: hypothetical protein [Oxalobacteraceae]HJV51351.1 hypothetical protein [Noviherbaspirillum sp.]
MLPEEIVDHIDAQNRANLHARDYTQALTYDEVLSLMNAASMRGFRYGSESALSLLKSKLLVKQLHQATSSEA